MPTPTIPLWMYWSSVVAGVMVGFGVGVVVYWGLIRLKKIKNKKEPFIRIVTRFLKKLENRFGEPVGVQELKKEFRDDYERVIKYLHSHRRSDYKLITGTAGVNWQIHNDDRALDRVQDIISRQVNEEILKRQSGLQKEQISLNFMLVTITLVLGLAVLLDVVDSSYRKYVIWLISVLTIFVLGFWSRTVYDYIFKN